DPSSTIRNRPTSCPRAASPRCPSSANCAASPRNSPYTKSPKPTAQTVNPPRDRGRLARMRPGRPRSASERSGISHLTPTLSPDGGEGVESRAARPRIVYLYLAIIVVSWAGNWPLMKLALADAPPLSFVLLRLIGTLALLAPVLL